MSGTVFYLVLQLLKGSVKTIIAKWLKLWPMLTAFNTRLLHLETPKLNAFCIDLIPYEINIALDITGWPAYCTGRVCRLVQNQESTQSSPRSVQTLSLSRSLTDH